MVGVVIFSRVIADTPLAESLIAAVVADIAGPFPEDKSAEERCNAAAEGLGAFSRRVSPVTGSTFLDEGPNGFGVLRCTRRNDHLLGLVIQ
jgi:hypothetical protein